MSLCACTREWFFCTYICQEAILLWAPGRVLIVRHIFYGFFFPFPCIGMCVLCAWVCAYSFHCFFFSIVKNIFVNAISIVLCWQAGHLFCCKSGETHHLHLFLFQKQAAYKTKMHRVRLLRLQTIISTITFVGVSVLSGASIAFDERTAAATCSSVFFYWAIFRMLLSSSSSCNIFVLAPPPPFLFVKLTYIKYIYIMYMYTYS